MKILNRSFNKKELSVNRTRKLKIRSFLVFALCMFFYTSKIWSVDTAEVKALKQNETVKFGARNIKLDQSNYYKDSDVLEAIFYFEHDVNEVLNPITIKAYNATTRKKLTLQVEEISKDYYVVFFENKNDFENCFMRFSSSVVNGSSQKTTSAPVYLSKKKATQKDKFTTKSFSNYQNEYIELMISIEKDNLKELNSKIKSEQILIENYEQQSKDLLENINLKTADEQQKIQTKINSNNQFITSKKTKIEKIEEDKAKILEKIEKLKQGITEENV